MTKINIGLSTGAMMKLAKDMILSNKDEWAISCIIRSYGLSDRMVERNISNARKSIRIDKINSILDE